MFPTYPDPDSLDVTPDEIGRIGSILSSLTVEVCKTRRLPENLYHYTTPAGFKGIVESGVLRATHVAYTNDGIEAVHAVKVLRACVISKQVNTSDPVEGVLLRAIHQGLEATTPFNTVPHVIACFCENGDLLSQWRGYGLGEGGIAIGFEAKKLAPWMHRGPGFLAPVLYDQPMQTKVADILLDQITAEYKATLSARLIKDQKKHLDDFLTVVGAQATSIGALLKHDGFAEENEWRLIHPVQRLSNFKFLPRATHLSPYVDLHVGSQRDGHPPLLPIAEVWFGPGRYQDQAVHSCGALLTFHGYHGIPLKRSKTPFRSML